MSRPNSILRAMISSTAIDLPEHRDRVVKACLRQGIFPIGMENLPAHDQDAVDTSFDMVDQADIFIGIYAWRYGLVPNVETNPDQKSITEMEFDRAIDRMKKKHLLDILVFVADEKHPIQPGHKQDGVQEKLSAFKERATNGRNHRKFTSPDNLESEVINALSHVKREPYYITNCRLHIMLKQLDSQQIRFDFELTGICVKETRATIKIPSFGLAAVDHWDSCGKRLHDTWQLGNEVLSYPGNTEPRKNVPLLDTDLIAYSYAYLFDKWPNGRPGLNDHHEFTFIADAMRLEFELPLDWDSNVTSADTALRHHEVKRNGVRRHIYHEVGPWRPGDRFDWELVPPRQPLDEGRLKELSNERT
jgi:hypothetical protein